MHDFPISETDICQPKHTSVHGSRTSTPELSGGADREAKCPYTLLLQHHCPLPAFMLSPQRSARLQRQAAVATAVPPAGHACEQGSELNLDLDLDYNFDSPPSSPAKEAAARVFVQSSEASAVGGGPAPSGPLEPPAPAAPAPKEGRPVRAGASQVAAHWPLISHSTRQPTIRLLCTMLI